MSPPQPLAVSLERASRPTGRVERSGRRGAFWWVGGIILVLSAGWQAAAWIHRAAAWHSGYLTSTAPSSSLASLLTEGYERLEGAVYFRQLARRLIRGAQSPRERVDRCLAWTYRHVRPQFAAPSRVVADDAYRIAKRGFGYCDQSAHVFCTLAHEAGVPARLYFLRDRTGQSRHTVAQVFIDGSWMFVDTLIGRVLEVHGHPLTLEALRENPALLEQAYADARDIIPSSAEEFLQGESFVTFPYGSVHDYWRRLLGRLER